MDKLTKTKQEIEVMRQSGALLAKALAEVVRHAKVGATTGGLDQLAEKILRKGGGEPSFLGYKVRASDRPYATTMCTSINHEIVHAPATPSRKLKDGDVVGFDIGVRYQGFCTDMAVTVGIGKVSKDAKRLIAVTRDSLMRGISVVRAGAKVSDIGRAVQSYVEKEGFGVVRDLVGHGVGRAVHEDPRIPNYVDPRSRDVVLEAGMTICIEPMVTAGSYRVHTLPDGWTIATVDDSLAAHFEVTLAVTDTGYEILTSLPS